MSFSGFTTLPAGNNVNVDVLTAALGGDNYFQKVPAEYLTRLKEPADSENVVAFIEGSEFPEEIIVLSAHLDHVGVDDKGNVFNGADDDGSGTVAMLEMVSEFTANSATTTSPSSLSNSHGENTHSPTAFAQKSPASSARCPRVSQECMPPNSKVIRKRSSSKL